MRAVPVRVGRPELVGTHPEFRNRGLIREQFAWLHARSEGKGELVQAITGIPWYYRQIEYEMALELGGGRVGYRVHLPEPQRGHRQAFRIRPVREEDAAFLASLSAQNSRRSMVSCLRDEALWKYAIIGRRRTNDTRGDIRVIETGSGESVGYLILGRRLRNSIVMVSAFEIVPSESWGSVTPSVLHFLRKRGEALAARSGTSLGAFAFWMGSHHPVYLAILDKLPRVCSPYSWYIRVPQLSAFLQAIAPVLERRLAATDLVPKDGQLRLNFYRSGLLLEFKHGGLAKAGAYAPDPPHPLAVAFPDWTFLQTLFGYRSLGELDYAFPDCGGGSDAARVLVNVLFPKRSSQVWGLS